jgi:hypothetical protein
MTTTTISASPAKLRDGSWGAKVATSEIAVGDTVQITTRAGKTWMATVERVVCSGAGYAIVATASTSTRPAARTYRPAARRSRAAWTGCRCGSLKDEPRDSDCASCQHDW